MLFVEANNPFAIDLYLQLVLDHEGENVFASPYSISSVLVMAAEGARGDTAAQMGKVLRFPSTLRLGDDTDPIPWRLAPLHESIAELNARIRTAVSEEEEKNIRDEIAQLQAEPVQINVQRVLEWATVLRREQKVASRLGELRTQLDQYEIRVANALWCEKTHPFRPEFMETIIKHHGTGDAFEVDFKCNPEESRNRINGWIAEQTNGRITDLIGPDRLNILTRLVLTNAIYFRGEWSEPFEEKETKENDFFLAVGGKSKTLMMEGHALRRARYAAFEADGSFFDTPHWIPEHPEPASKVVDYPRDDGFALLELPYKGDRLSMVLIAPNRPGGLHEVESMLTSENLRRWIEQLRRRPVHVMLPKFGLESHYSMAEVLERLGMVRAFKDPLLPGGAQFGGITSLSDPGEQLMISAVLHKALLEVNEKGTTAVASNALMTAERGLNPQIPFVPMFRANRPFMFLIQDRPTGAILFIGRMVRPVTV